ncbi:MAG: restriction endonuclease subunit S, partial [Clostridia bacterium]|nr:restriction endonuclease subunit S [Clostridia bacterium]
MKVIDFRGRTPKKLGMDWSEDGYLALSALNVKNGYIDESIDAHYGNQELYDKWMTGNELHKGQVLFTTEAPMGNVAQVPDNKRYILSQRTIAFEVDEENITENYLAVILRSPNIFNKLTALSSGGTAKGVSQKSMSELTIPIPKDTVEQNKIGEYFQQLDNLITLHQRKYEFLYRVFLCDIFAKSEEITPTWEQRKFTEVFIYLQNNSLSRADLNYEQGLIKNVHYGDVLIKFGEILDVESAELPFISNNEFTVSNTSLLQNGDVVIADAAEDETVGKCSEIKGIEGINVVSGLHTIPCRPNMTFASGYLGYYLNSSAYHDQLLPLIQGTKISSISKSALLNTDIIYPD